MMFLNDIKAMPTTLNNVHESSFRSYHILQKVIQMVARCDSRESIVELADYLQGGGRLKEIYTVNENTKQ